MNAGCCRSRSALAGCLALVFTLSCAQAEDAYEHYVRHSEDFARVRQDRDWALRAWPSWLYLPWTYRWGIGYDERAGRWSRDHGYNGAFVDRDGIGLPGKPRGRLDWIETHGLHFYTDHVAGKGVLHLWDGNAVKPHLDELHGTGVRPVPLNEATFARLQNLMQRHISAVSSSTNRVAYALDDEPSWGHFVHPAMWRLTEDTQAYRRWLEEVYGKDHAPRRERWYSYDDFRNRLADWSVGEFDVSALLDQWSFNDSHWCNYLGRLVRFSNELDPLTPCGIVGGQAPNAFGGYDYAKLMRKVQFIESYNLGSSQAIIRSFNPGNALPAVTTHFHRSVADTIWQTWYYLAHGNRGHIGWVDGWFDDRTPRSWHAQVAPHFKEAAERIGPLMNGATWRHDGVAIYYSHASIQLGWILDAQAHGRTWRNRNGDHRLASAALVRKAWEDMLRDDGIQYDFLNYVDVIQRGIPSDFRVLILPACLCLSDVEARRIREFCERGGKLIADYLPGVWDQHGRGRRNGGALDDLFGVRHRPDLRAGDVFGDQLWVEVDQDRNFSWRTYEEFLTRENTCQRDRGGFHKAVRELPVGGARQHGRGEAVLMNLSPQWYNAYRMAGGDAARRRDVFTAAVRSKVGPRWVDLVAAGEDIHGYEFTRWQFRNGRNLVFLCLNPEIKGSATGGGNSVGLKTDRLNVHIRFRNPVRNVRDERTGELLGNGPEFQREWAMNEAVVLSFDEK